MSKLLFFNLAIVLVTFFLVVCLFIDKIHGSVSGEDVKTIQIERSMESHYFMDVIYSNLENDGTLFPINVGVDDTMFVCYYSDMSCSSCVLFARNKVVESMGVSPTYVLFNQTNGPVRTDELVVGKSPLKHTDQVAYFVLENNVVRHYFIPDKKYQEYVDMYLLWIRNKYKL